MLKNLPKAELHVHLEGTLTPTMVHELARQHGIEVARDIFSADGRSFQWKDFTDFHRVFDESFKVVRSKEDYQYITYTYLKTLAEQNTLYAELIVAPHHAGLNGVSYDAMLQGLVAGIDAARNDFGIEGRILMVFMRHYGPNQAMMVAEEIVGELHPYVVGVNLVGDIKQYAVGEFAEVFALTRKAGLGVSCHAGELEGGPIEIWQAINELGATRISHGINCVKDPQLMEKLIKRNITLEICPSSNIVLKMFPNYEAHPLKQIHQAGIKVTLNTDDPAFFNTNLTHEYEIGKKYYNFTEQDLLQCTINALQAGFMDAELKSRLLADKRLIGG